MKKNNGGKIDARQLDIWRCCNTNYSGKIKSCRICKLPRDHYSNPECGGAKPERTAQMALGEKSQITEALGGFTGRLHIIIERHAPRMLDDDNAIGGAKQLRDAIASLLDRKGDSEKDGLTFKVTQVLSKTRKTVIKFFRV